MTSAPIPPDNEKRQERKPLHIIFLHLDLGIGGAEQLVINLATASANQSESNISIFTTHCDPHHCFDEVKKPDGSLCQDVNIYGSFIPPNLFGYGTALFSTFRMLYLTFMAMVKFPHADMFVLDVLPTSIPLVKFFCANISVLFYCHFPDKFLTRDTVNGMPSDSGQSSELFSFRSFYRRCMDGVEENAMQYADLIAVNSEFTKAEVSLGFPTLLRQEIPLRVLYPAIDLTKFILPNFDLNEIGSIVSLNRFERKKNIEILIRAYAQLYEKIPGRQIPNLVIAGGYDHRNSENIEYLQELRTLAFQTHHLSEQTVLFRPNVSDEERAELLRGALCVCYTPHREHFGIVPLEAMYAGTPVIAVKSGGPCETVIDGQTGFLVDNSCEGFSEILVDILKQDNPMQDIKEKFGRKGHSHVANLFGLEKFQKDWERLLDECLISHQDKRRKDASSAFCGSCLGFGLILEIGTAILLAWVFNYCARFVGFVPQKSNVWREVKGVVNRVWDEL